MNTEKDQNNKKEEGGVVTTGFKAGSGTVKVKVVFEQNLGVSNGFVHSMDTVNNLIDNFSSKTYADEQQRNNDPMTFDDWKITCNRLISLAVAKKLCYSMTSSDMNSYEHELNVISKCQFPFPTHLVPYIDGLGSIIYNDVAWTMVGQPCLAFTYAYRGLAREDIEEPDVDREEVIYVNLAWHRPFEPGTRYLRGVVNSWADLADAYNVGGDGAGMRIHPPRFRSGAIGYLALTQAANRPVRVTNALNALRIIEEVGNNPPNDQQIAGLAAVNVVVVTQTRAQIAELLRLFTEEVVDSVTPSLQINMKIGELKGFKRNGSEWQLMKKQGPNLLTCPYPLKGQDLEFGLIAACTETGFLMSGHAVQTTLRSESYEMMSDYLRRGFKSHG